MTQRRLVPPGIQGLIEGRAPEFTARVAGAEYARVYRIPSGVPVTTPGRPPEPLPGDDDSDDEGG